MKRIGSHIILLFAFTLLLGLALNAQNFKASVSKNPVAAGERFKLSFTLDGSGGKFSPPNLSGFRVYSGPNQSSSMQMINGNVSHSYTISYILAATSEGNQTINPATIVVGGKAVKSNSINLQVTKAAAQQPQQQQNKQQAQKPSNEIQDNIFLKASIDKTNAFVNEQIVVTYKIYTRVNIVQNSVEKLPNFNGFIAQDVDLPQNPNITTEVVNGVQFNVATLKQTVLFPQRTGKLEIDKMIMSVTARIRENRTRRSIFDSFFGSFRDVPLELESNSFTINVKPLPSGKTAGFTGAVGNFKLKTTLDKTAVKANEALNFTVSISGSGNLDLIDELPIDFPADFEVYDPKITNNTTPSGGGLAGRKTFEYLLIPRFGGTFEIPSSTFSFFNPSTGKYESITTDAYEIKVEKGANDPATSSSYAPSSKEDLKVVGKDIRYIKTDTTKIEERNSFFFGTLPYYFFMIIPWFSMLVFWWVWRNKQKQEGNISLLKAKRAGKEAEKRLKSARELLDEDNNHFYNELAKGLTDYLSDKLTIPMADFNITNLETKLQKNKVDQPTMESTIKLLKECELARFAPSAQVSKQELFEQAKRIINHLQRVIK